MNRRLAAFLSSSLLLAAILSQPAWTQTTTQPAVQPAAGALPEKFDLRDVGAVTPIKSQIGGTCWTHGTCAAIESHLLISGKWKALGMKGIPMLAEYHLDWWNGFNKKFNEDVKESGKDGLTVHQGGDYRVAAAYISRGDGVVIIPQEEGKPYDPKAWHKETPKDDPTFKKLYVRDIEWFVITDKGDKLEGIELIKQRIMKEGALGTCYMSNGKMLSKENIHYQPMDNKGDPNHSVAIIGWDDTKISAEDAKKAPKPGAWLIKNSWGEKRGDKGYYWISYYDKHSARHPEMGAVSFRNVEPLQYTHIYYHDAHGWRDELSKIAKGFNAYKATDRQTMKAVSFYTAAHNVNYTVKVFGKFENGKLSNELVSQTGNCEFCGFHTIDLRAPVQLKENDMFYIMLEVSAGGQCIDRTSNIPVLLEEGLQGKGAAKPIVFSTAKPGESFYFENGEWKDLHNYQFEMPKWAQDRNISFNGSANFCMKALCVKTP